jgi:two-component system NtrC family sensor kinase
VSRDTLLGVLTFYTLEEDHLSEEGITLLTSFADQSAVAIENARLFSEIQRRATTLEVLDEIGKAIKSTLDLEELFQTTARQVMRVVPCARASLFTADADCETYSRIFVVDDEKSREQSLSPERLRADHWQEAVKSKRPLYIPDVRLDPHPRRRNLAARGLRSIINVPIVSEGECIGFLNVSSSRVNAYRDEHIEMVSWVADRLAVAMKNAELYGQVRETGERLDNFVRSAFHGIITTDLNGGITSWNPGAEHLYGHTEEEVVGRALGRSSTCPTMSIARYGET